MGGQFSASMESTGTGKKLSPDALIDNQAGELCACGDSSLVSVSVSLSVGIKLPGGTQSYSGPQSPHCSSFFFKCNGAFPPQSSRTFPLYNVLF